MPNNYTFLDSDGSVLTGRTSITSGSAHEPLITISSALSAIPITQSGTRISSVVNALPSSMLTGASIFGQLPAGTAVLGSVATLQGTLPWAIAGSVLSFQGTTIWNISSVYGNISGSVVAVQGGAWSASMVGAPITSVGGTAAGGDRGVVTFGYRNDALASAIGANLTYRVLATDSAGRVLTRPFSPEESRIEGYASTVNLNANSIIAAAGAGLRNYITDVWVANTGAANTLVTFLSGGGLSVLGYTIAPTVGGSNLPGLVTPIRTGVDETFDFRAATGTSVLYITAKGFKAP